ncbi:MAG TPA: cytochrome d ubiquinol oxidase subunit II [Candidatus Saccharimonadales bacterium]|nr:cytochrome d ubiquinol oxidase subunit II [Candidatus Saccharimonadales bacterium]
MGLLWFAIVAFLLAGYVILDGFDIGAGALHFFLGRTDNERRKIMRAIGPVWDGNEVWLLATGGVLYCAFPQLYASSFSGFYLPLMMVLWLLMLRAIGLEFRTHIDDGIWASLFDGVFAIGSLLLAIFYGAALGNVVRGVPLGPDHYFFLPLWTNWRVGAHPGVLDWYTVLAGVVTLVALSMHGANYLVVKTDGALNERARKTSLVLTPVLIVLTLLSLVATLVIHPNLLANYNAVPIGYAIPVLVFASMIGVIVFQKRRQEIPAFVCGALYLAFMLVGAVYSLYPVILPGVDPQYNLTVQNSITASYGLQVGLRWWILGMVIALGYFVFLYRMFRGKVVVESHSGYGD